MDHSPPFQSRVLKDWTAKAARDGNRKTPSLHKYPEHWIGMGMLAPRLRSDRERAFLFGLRRFLPLWDVLFWDFRSGLLALGMLDFHNLNMIAIGFCSILVGLGVALVVLFGRYCKRVEGRRSRTRRFCGPSATSGPQFLCVVTTAIGFWSGV